MHKNFPYTAKICAITTCGTALYKKLHKNQYLAFISLVISRIDMLTILLYHVRWRKTKGGKSRDRHYKETRAYRIGKPHEPRRRPCHAARR